MKPSRTFLVTGNNVEAISRRVDHRNLVFSHVGNVRLPQFTKPALCSPNVYFHYCDKNFLYFAMAPRVLPKVKRIFVNSHPCECEVLHRWYHASSPAAPGATIFLTEPFASYKRRWAFEEDYVRVISLADYDKRLQAALASQ